MGSLTTNSNEARENKKMSSVLKKATPKKKAPAKRKAPAVKKVAPKKKAPAAKKKAPAKKKDVASPASTATKVARFNDGRGVVSLLKQINMRMTDDEIERLKYLVDNSEARNYTDLVNEAIRQMVVAKLKGKLKKKYDF